MPAMAQSTAATQFRASQERDSSDTPSVAERLVHNVDQAVGWASVPQIRDTGASTAPRQMFTGGEQNGRASVIDPAPASAKPILGASLHALQEWEGHVVEIGDTEFVARLVDMTAGASHEEEEAVIPRAELSDCDNAKISNGAIFRWVIGYERSPTGTKRRVSQIVFRDLPAITESDLRDGETWARRMAGSLNP